MAQAALNEDLTIPQVHSILSESPRFKEIDATLGSQKAEQFASIAITAAQRQNTLDSLPEPLPQVEPQIHKRHQPRLGS